MEQRFSKASRVPSTLIDPNLIDFSPATPSIVSEMVCHFHRHGEITRDYVGTAGESRMFAAFGLRPFSSLVLSGKTIYMRHLQFPELMPKRAYQCLGWRETVELFASDTTEYKSP